MPTTAGTKDRHIGDAGRHQSHILELLTNGVVYCTECKKKLSFKEADIAWAPVNQSQF